MGYFVLLHSIFGKSHVDEKMDEKTPAGSVNLLDDTLLESPSSVAGSKMSKSLPHTYVFTYTSDKTGVTFVSFTYVSS